MQDLIRRVKTFGLNLMRLDIRQESDRHSEAIDAITSHMGLGKYTSWTEEKKIEWLTSELMSQRPLYHRGTFRCNEDVQEVSSPESIISARSRAPCVFPPWALTPN